MILELLSSLTLQLTFHLFSALTTSISTAYRALATMLSVITLQLILALTLNLVQIADNLIQLNAVLTIEPLHTHTLPHYTNQHYIPSELCTNFDTFLVPSLSLDDCLWPRSDSLSLIIMICLDLNIFCLCIFWSFLHSIWLLSVRVCHHKSGNIFKTLDRH